MDGVPGQSAMMGGDVVTRVSPAVDEAWAASFLSRLPEPVARRLRDTAITEEHSAGEIVYDARLRHDATNLALVLQGLLRVSLSSTNGREVTLRYADWGEVIGLPAAIAGGARDVIQAITDCRLLRVDVATLRYFGRSDPAVAWVLCQELAAINFSANERLSMNVFQSVGERVAGSLLDMARDDPDGMIVRASHQDIADAIGSVREVVARAIRQLRDLRLIERRGGGMVLLDPEALARMAGALGQGHRDEFAAHARHLRAG